MSPTYFSLPLLPPSLPQIKLYQAFQPFLGGLVKAKQDLAWKPEAGSLISHCVSLTRAGLDDL